MHISLIHPTGNPNSLEAAIAFCEAHLLYEIITTIAFDPNSAMFHYLNLLPKNISKHITDELGRRTWVTPNRVPIRTHSWREIIRILLIKTGLSECLRLRQQQLVDWIYASIDSHVAKHHLQGLSAVYAYEDGAAATFRVAKQQGILCLYDLPIPFYRINRDIQMEEAKNLPELASALQALDEPRWKIERKKQEIQLADHIFVASSFTKKSLLEVGVQKEKISVIPYGAPIEYFQPQTKTDKIFRALFVGRITPGKGVQYLLKAWQELQLYESELLLVGINQFPKNWLSQYQDVFRHIPSIPHALLNQYYSAASVFVFPSLLEGFGLVLLEAMACGIPVITTSNTAGPDILTDGVEGFIIPIRDVEALKEKLEWCYSHPQELAEMGRAARRKAEKLTWSLYRQQLASKVKEILEQKHQMSFALPSDKSMSYKSLLY
jgi:glycosyltransferase involved in cell wall biosynthesis